MNKIFTSCLLFLILFFSPLLRRGAGGEAAAQAPQGINYQAVARDVSGNPLATTAVTVDFNIYKTNPPSLGGILVYTETHNTNTNQFGLFNLVIGSITPANFSAILWGTDKHFLEVIVNGNNMGTTQFLSVPYSLYSEKSGGASPTGVAGGDLTGTYPNPQIGNNTIVGPEISNGAVTTGTIANDAVTTPKIIDAAVTTLKIANDAVTTTKIAADAVTTSKIIDNAVTGQKIFITGEASGSLMYSNGADWQNLGIGANGHVLQVISGVPTWTTTATAPPAWSLGGNTLTGTAPNPNEWIGSANGFDFVLRTGGTERMRILAGGNVGIGTASPSNKFEVAGAGNISAQISSSTAIANVAIVTSSATAFDYAGLSFANPGFSPGTRMQFFTSASPTPNEFRITHFPNAPITLFTNNAERLRISGTGNVGIGTTNPLTLLHLSTTGTALEQRLQGTAGPGLTLAIKFFDGVAGDQAGIIYSQPHLQFMNRTGSGFLQFYTNTIQRMAIDNNGNVGIGIATPSNKLEVAGDAKIQNMILSTGHIYVPSGNLQLTGGGVQSSRSHILIPNGGGIQLNADNSSAQSIRLNGRNNGGYILLDSANVGIRTSAPNTALDLNGAFSVRGMTTAPAVSPATQGRIYFDQIAGKFKVSENAGAYVDLVTAASNLWTDGGTVIYPTTLSDFVGIGTASPTTELEVAGEALIKNATTLVQLTLQNTSTNVTGLTLLSPTQAWDFGLGVENGSQDFQFFDAIAVKKPLTLQAGTGYVGINNPAPTEELDVAGSVRFSGDLQPNADPGVAGEILVSQGAGMAPDWQSAGALAGPWSSAGGMIYPVNLPDNVGIGTNTPSYPIHILSGGEQLRLESTGGNFKAGHTIKTGLNEWFIGQEGLATTGFRISDVDAGATRFEIDPIGNVGIGVTGPASKLEVAGTIHSTSGGIKFPDNTIQLSAAGAFVPTASPGHTLRYGATQWVAESNLYNDGMNVGIGTTAPTSKLDVSGNVNISSGNIDPLVIKAGQDGFGVRIMESDNGNDAIGLYGYSSRGRIFLKDNGTIKVDIDGNGDTYFNGGNVGVGITPSYKLHVSSNTANSRIMFEGNGGSGNPTIYVKANAGAGHAMFIADRADNGGLAQMEFRNNGTPQWIIGTPDFSAGDATRLDFSTAYNTPKMTLLQNGNLGIGISAPTAPLHVSFTTSGSSASAQKIDYTNTSAAGGNKAGLMINHSGNHGAGVASHGVLVTSSNAGGAGTVVSVGGYASGGVGDKRGLEGNATGAGATNTAVFGQILGAGATNNYGVYADAQSTAGTNYGIYARASGGASNYAIVVPSTGGNVGIGTTSPSWPLTVAANNANFAFRIDQGNTSGDGALIYANTTSAARTIFQVSSNVTGMHVLGNGNVGIGTSAPGSHKLSVVGTAGLSTGTAWTNTSDIRLKDINGDYEYGLNEIIKLHTIRFNYKKDNSLGLPSDVPMIGFAAQEVQKLIPDAVKTRPDGYLELNVDPIHWAAINAIKELNAKIESQQKEIELLKAENGDVKKLKSDNLAMKAEIEKIKMQIGIDAKAEKKK